MIPSHKLATSNGNDRRLLIILYSTSTDGNDGRLLASLDGAAADGNDGRLLGSHVGVGERNHFDVG